MERLEERTLLSADSWTGLAGTTDWATAGNWSNGVPTSTSDVTINGNVTVVHSSGNDTVNTITLGTGATLQITGNSIIAVQGTSGPQVSSDGTIDLGNSTTYGQLLFSTATGSLQGTGSINLSSNGNNALEPGYNDTLTIASTVSVNASGGQIGYYYGVLDNQATITASAASGQTVYVELGGPIGTNGSNSGTITATSGNLQVLYGYSNTGTISISGGGTLTLGGSTFTWTNTGSITTTSSTVDLGGAITQTSIGTLNRDSGSTINLTGTLTGGLTLNATTGSWYLLGGTVGGAVTASGSSLLYATNSGGTLSAVSLDSTNALDLQTVNGAYAYVTGGLTLSSTTLTLGNSAGTTYGRLLFNDTTNTIQGAGTIDLGASGSNLLYEGSGDTLTIPAAITVNAAGGQIGYYYGILNNQTTITTSAASGQTVYVYLGGPNGSGTNTSTITATKGNLYVGGPFTNTGTISLTGGGNLTLTDAFTNSAAVSIAGGGTLTLGSGTAAWTNTGTITVTTSAVDLAGAITQSSIGTLNRDSGSTINLTGTLTGGLTLNATTGSWYLLGGNIGGAVTASGGSLLYATNYGGTLSAVSLDSTNALDLQTVNGAYAYVAGGLTLSSTTLTLGNSAGTTYGRLLFNDATNTIQGTGTIDLGASGSNILYQGYGDTLTIPAAITVNAAGGQIGYYYGILTNQTTITASAASGQTVSVYLGGPNGSGTNSSTITATSGNLYVGGPFSNTGTISLTGGGNLTLTDAFTNSAAVSIAGGGTLTLGSGTAAWTNTGTITVTTSAVDLAGAITQSSIGTLNRDSGSTINLTGTLTGGLTLNATTGSWYLLGGTVGGAVTASGGSLLYATNYGGTLSAVSLDSTDALDLQTVNGAYAYVIGGLTLSGTTITLGNSSGTTYGRLIFNDATNTIQGIGTIDLGASGNNALYQSYNDTLTIPSTVVVNAAGGQIGYYYGILNNQTTITADAASGQTVYVELGGPNGSGTDSGTIIATSGNLQVLYAFTNSGTISIAGGGTLTLGGTSFTWSNTGTIITTASTVDLSGAITQAALGTLNRDSGSTINLTGTLTGGLTLDAITGSWYLLGGTVGGAVTASGGSLLYATNSGGTLSAVSLDSTNALDVQTVNGAYAYVTGGLTLSGTTITLGNSSGTTYGRLIFNDATNTIQGTGTIDLGPSGSNSLYQGYNDTLTIPSTVAVNAAGGTIGYYYGILKNQTTVTADAAPGQTVYVELGGPNGSGTNSGTITAASGNLQVLYAFTNSGTITISGGGALTLGYGSFAWTNTGTVTTTGSTVNLGGAITQAAIGTLDRDSGSTINLTGTLTGGLTLNATTGPWYLQGGTLSGALTASGGSLLYATSYGGYLTGVSLNATNPLDLQTVNGANVSVTNSLTLAGTTIDLGNSAGTTYGGLYFSATSGTLLGTGTIDFGSSFSNFLEPSYNDTLTIAAGIRMNVAGGVVGYYYGMVNNQGTIVTSPVTGSTDYVYLGGPNGNGNNSGTIAGASGNLDVYGGLTNPGTISLAGGGTLTLGGSGRTWSSVGTVQVHGGVATLQGTVNEISSGTLTAGTWNALGGATIQFPAGTIITTNAATLTLSGAGAAIIGLGSLTTNRGSLTLTNGASIIADFTNSGTLTVGPGSTLRASDPVSYYPMDGSTNDQAGLNNPSATNALSFTTGEFGQGVTFGTGGYIDIPDSSSLDSQQLSIAAWVNPQGAGPNNDSFGNVIVAKGINGGPQDSAYLDWRATDDRFVFYVYNGSPLASTDAFAPGKFYHVAATYDGTTASLYVNGVLEGQEALATEIGYDHTVPWTIGSSAGIFRSSGFPRTWNGVIDEVRIYNHPLSTSEIQTLAAGTLPSPTSFTQTASGTLNVQIGGTPASGLFGQVIATGAANLGGTFNLSTVNGFGTTIGQAYPVMSYASAAGSFATVIGVAPNFSEAVNPTNLTVTAITNSVDLAATSVTAPSSATPGQTITVNWHVMNQSATPATGRWVDSVYVSPTPTITAQSILLGTQSETGNPNTGVQYDGSLTTALPGLPAGNYYVLVQVDNLDQLPDSNRANNTLAATGPLTISVPTVALGVGKSGTFTAADQDQYYEVNVPAGGTLQITLTSTASSGAVALYVSQGTFPTPHDFQESAVSNQPSATVAVPQVLTAGTYYILAHSVAGAAATAGYTLTATQTSTLGVFAISTYPGGNAGNVTVEIDGTNFAANATASLTGSTTINASAIDFVNASQIFATFNLQGAAQGSYTLGVQQGAQSATAVKPFHVVAASPTALNVVLITPQFVHTGRTGTVTITYTNTTSEDIIAPLLMLSSSNPHVAFSTPDDPNDFTQSAQVLAVAGQGPAGILRPQQSGQLTLELLSNDSLPGDQIPVQVTQVQAGQTIDWAARKASLKPGTFSSAAWDVVFANVLAAVGNTTDSYNAALAAAATYLGSLGETTADVSDVSRLWSFLVAQGNAAFPSAALVSAVDASLPVPGKLPLAVDRTFVSSIAGRYQPGIFGLGWMTSWQTSVSVDGLGNVAINSGGALRYFVLQADGTYLDTAGETGTLTQASGIYTLTTKSGTQYVFLASGALDYMQDANGNRITLGCNSNSQLVTLTYSNPGDPSEPTAQLTLTYNGQGLVSQVTDGNGGTYAYSYDSAGHLLSVAGPGGLTTSYTYDTGNNAETTGALLSVTQPDGSQLSFTYDAQGRLSSTSQNGGADPITYSYGGQAQVTATDAAGDQTIVFYNDLGLPSRVVDPRGGIASYLYDAGGNLVGYTDAAGNSYQYAYDAGGNLTQVVNPLGQSVQMTYGALGNLTSLTDAAGNTTRYQSDPAGNLLSITYPGGEMQSFQYDPLGNPLATIEPNGDTVNYQRNAQGQIATETFVDGSSQAFTYDAHGHVLTAKTYNASGTLTGTTTLTYNAAGELTSVTYPNSLSLTFSYNAQGQRTQSVDQSGFTINYAYDSLGRLTKLTDGSNNLIVQYKYNSVGQLQEKDNGNGTYTTYAYDTAGNLTSEVNYAGGTTVNSSFTYTYNALGQVTSVTDNANQTTAYGYDARGQLTQVTLPGGQTITYTYNAAGDRTAAVVGNTTTTFTSNADNQVTQVGSATYTYDPNGNLHTVTDAGGTTTYTYNDLNQLVSIQTPDGTTTTLQYSPLGYLVGTNVGGTQTNFLVDPTGAGNVVATYNGSSLIAHFTYGLGLVSQTGPSGTGYYDFDHGGNTVGITGSNGAYVNRYSYLPFGETTTLSATLPNPFTFAGQAGILQVGANLFFMRARDYSAVTAQFLSNDPLGLGGGDPNVREYVFNDPVTFIDLTGLLAQAANAALQAYAGLVSQLYQQYSAAANTSLSPLPSQSYYTGPLFVVGSREPEPVRSGPVVGQVRASGVAGGGGGAGGAGASLPAGLSSTTTTNGASTNQPAAHDPNDLLGPSGSGVRNFIAPTGAWSYTIDFENDGTAAAKTVTISEQLDPNLDWSTFQLGSFSFGPVKVSIPAGMTEYQTSVAYRNTDASPLNVAAAFDFNVQTGLLTATFTSLDPATGQTPAGILDGFLPPDDNAGIGKAFVQYTVQPKSGLPTYATVHQQAAVVFDGQAAQNTNLVTHTIDAGFPADRLVVQTPTQALPGGKMTITVSAEGSTGQVDPLYGGSVSLALSGAPAGVRLSGVLVAPVKDGVATFTNLSLNAVGTLTVLAASTSNLMPMAATVNVVPAPVLQVTLKPVTTGQTGAGQQFTATVTALLGGNPDTGYLGTVQLSSNDPHAAGLPASYTFQGTDGGTRSFTFTLETAGTRTVTATDASRASVHATSNGIGVTPIAVSQFAVTPVTQQPPVIGSPYAVTVTAEDQYGNKVSNYTGTVHFSATSGTATLPNDFTFTAINHGSHGFIVTPTSVGGLTLQVGDNSHSGSLSVTVVSAGTHLTVQVSTTKPTAGSPFQVTVSVFTASGQPDTNFRDTLHFAAGGLALDQPFTSATGTQDFNITLTQAGIQTITVTDTSRPQIKGTSPRVTVAAAGVNKLTLSARAVPAVFGTADTVSLTAVDPYGNPVTGYTGTVHVTVSGGSATVPAPLTLTGPTATFTFTPQSLGSLTLNATDGTNSGSLPLTVVSAATHLGITGIPPSITAGKQFTLTVSALNAAGKPVSPFQDVLHFSDNLGNTGLPADAAFSGTNGQEQFNFTLPDAGKQTITVTDASQGRVLGVFLTDTVKPAGGTGPTASVSGPTIGVPGQRLTFTLTASGTGTVFTYHIDWAGNGSVLQTVTGGSSLTVTHVYPKTGTFTPKVTAVDAAGDAGSQAAAPPVSITTTALETDPTTGQATALAVGLPQGGGTLTITPANADGTDITLKLGSMAPALPAQPFSHLFVFGQGGTDVVQEPTAGQTTTVGVSVVIFGGTGTNVLSMANSRVGNVLIGGPGHSTLTGGSGADILIGGGGPAVLHAGSGGDILIAGSTIYDTNATALLMLLKEWDRMDATYSQRVADLFGTGSGGQNGPFVLTAQTVARDTAMSQLFGGAGMDWYWLSASGKAPDQLNQYADGEVVSFE